MCGPKDVALGLDFSYKTFRLLDEKCSWPAIHPVIIAKKGMSVKLFGSKHKATPEKVATPPAKKDVPASPTGGGQDYVRKRKILVVDDDMIIVKTLTLKLEAAGYEVISAPDGAAAVSLARHENPDLVILDINFPPDVGMSWDGFKIMEWFQRPSDGGKFPVIIITGDDSSETRKRAETAGAHSFFRKPVNTNDLLATIKNLFG